MREWVPPRVEPLVPPSLELVGWRRLGEEGIEFTVRYMEPTAACPHCQTSTGQVHARRLQRKRDQDWQGRAVWLVLERRRFRCWRCDRVFSEPDPVCGSRRRTTRRRRERASERQFPHWRMARGRPSEGGV
jgi:transposase